MDGLKIAFVTSEAVPYAKTGGLADVSGVLPGIIRKSGNDCRMFMPLYGFIKRDEFNLEELRVDIGAAVGHDKVVCRLYGPKDSTFDRPTYFIENQRYFNRNALYVDPKTGRDYTDNDERFLLFAAAVLESLKKLDWRPDIIHANDWQSALVVTFLKTKYRDEAFFKGIKTVLTIHNLAYQGTFPAEVYPKLNLPDIHFAPGGPLEYWGKVNFLKSGIVFADKITTVSPTYASEIQSSNEYGMGLEGVLKNRRADLVGILNGVDYNTWSPKKDRLIPYNYFIANLSNKKRNKMELLHKAGLPLRIDSPLLAMISRLDSQKGFDILAEIMDDIMENDVQFILLGTGAPEYHALFERLERTYPDKMKIFLKFDNILAHLIEAGADIFIMPSRYEPCGLNQLYSLKYGTVPVVRRTGGLADTVKDFDENSKTGTGIVFDEYSPGALKAALIRAITLFGRRRLWYKIVKQGMSRDFSWERSGERYIRLYRSL